MESFSISELKSNLSLTLYEYRIEHNLSRKELATNLNISLNSLTKIENGNTLPTLITLSKYAIYFKTSISKIIEKAEIR